MAKVYVASSWRNAYQPMVVRALRQYGHEVYDFRNPAPGNTGFQWSEIDPDWRGWNQLEYRAALDHPISVSGFALDKGGMDWADVCVLVLPSGRSAHLEAGYMAGQGKLVIPFVPDAMEPELMYKLLAPLVISTSGLLDAMPEVATP